tara:strand:- start:5461 stop:5859 length:399 start_codon:yes stop_codon:yes gene_type:complete
MVNQTGFKKIEDKEEGLESNKERKIKKKESGIPKHIANRMARRVLFTTGLPTICGMGVFVISYVLITRGIAEIAPTLTLLLSGSFFLLGLVGLSYGILSASWENEKGSFLGIENVGPNIKRMKAAFNSKETS